MGGLTKLLLAIVQVAIPIIIQIVELTQGVTAISDRGHALAATVAYAVFVGYVMTDMALFGHRLKDRLADITVIILATYWWIGFLAKYSIPSEPFFPESWYPRPLAYLGIAACFAGWAYWDLKVAMSEADHDRMAASGAIALLIGIAISLVVTLSAPGR